MTSLLPSEVLSRAADLIEPEGAWTRFTLAAPYPASDEAEADVIGITEHDPDAHCWCAMGAIWRAAPAEPSASVAAARREALTFLLQEIRCAVPAFNDAPERTQSEVVSALRAASELARREGK